MLFKRHKMLPGWMFFALWGAAFLFLPLRMAAALDDALLAVVNDEVITVKDLKEYMKGIYSQLKIEGKTPKEINEIMAQYEYKGIEQLIEDRLILSSADKAGVIIRPKAVDERIDEIKKNYASPQEFTAALNREGLTVSDIRRKIENQIKSQAMVSNEVRAKVFVNPSEVTGYYTANLGKFVNKARVYIDTVFIKVEAPQDKDAAKAKILEAASAVKGGMVFADAVTKYSDLPSVGEVAVDQLRPEFKDRIDKMKVGDISDVIDVPEGFYLVKLEGRSSETAATLAEVKDRIYQELYDKRFRERLKAWVDGLRKKAYVEIKQ